MSFEKVIIGNAELYCGDCREVLPTLGKVDAVITDPPYGIGKLWGGGKICGTNGKSRLWENDSADWDMNTIDSGVLFEVLNRGETIICWGGNYYPMPPSRCWLIWDKIQVFTGCDFEMAWTNMDKAAKAFRMSRIDAYMNKSDGKKTHPTEKPVQLMKWCIQQAGMPETVLDPFMGSGTTGVACMNLDRKFIGIEMEPKYFDIACRRIEQAQQQLKLF